MNFTLVILGPPYASQAPETALRFATAALASGHKIYRLFFYHDGVHNASNLATVGQDEHNIPEHWRKIIEDEQIDSVVCIAAATRRGIVSVSEAQRHDKPCANLISGQTLSGLGQLIDASLNSDRVITFGA